MREAHAGNPVDTARMFESFRRNFGCLLLNLASRATAAGARVGKAESVSIPSLVTNPRSSRPVKPVDSWLFGPPALSPLRALRTKGSPMGIPLGVSSAVAIVISSMVRGRVLLLSARRTRTWCNRKSSTRLPLVRRCFMFWRCREGRPRPFASLIVAVRPTLRGHIFPSASLAYSHSAPGISTGASASPQCSSYSPIATNFRNVDHG